MTTETVWKTGREAMYADELINALNEANEECGRLDDEGDNDANVFFFVQDQHGHGVKNVRVTCDVLSDGSKAYTVVLDLDY